MVTFSKHMGVIKKYEYRLAISELLTLIDQGAEIVDKFKWKVGKRGKSFCVSCGKNSFYGHQNDCKLNEWLEAVRDD